jgi:hypothetical protein
VTADLEIELLPQPLYAGPQFAMSGERAQVLYHLNFFNRTGRPLTLRRVRLSAEQQGQLLFRQELSRRFLEETLRPAPWIVMTDRQSIAAANRWRGALERRKGDTRVPPRDGLSLTHQLTIAQFDQLPDRIRVEVEHDRGHSESIFTVETYRQKTRLRLPVEGPWWVMAGHRFDEEHGTAVLLSQNFAYDLGVLGPTLSTFDGDMQKNSAYFSYGRPVLAAADGRVVEIADGMADNQPVGTRPSFQEILRRPQDLAGNYVVVQHQADEFSAYLHLKPGLTVKKGLTVRAGQTIGFCGNTGNSLESHLHFQLQDGPDFFTANGLPIRFSDFSLQLGHLRFYVPAERSLALPVRLVVEAGRVEGAANLPGHLIHAGGSASLPVFRP